MLLRKSFEYLFYLVVFILMFKFSQAARIDIINESVPQKAADMEPSDAGSKRAIEDCASGFSWMCLKIEFVKLMERLTEQNELNILPGVSVVKDANATALKTAEMMAGT